MHSPIRVGIYRLEECAAHELTPPIRDDVEALLTSRFPTSAALINALLRPGCRKKLFCHNHRTHVAIPPHHVTVLLERSRVVATGLVNHVPLARRQPAEHKFTQVLLLAVSHAEERRGLGRAMVRFMWSTAAAAHSRKMLIMSNRSAFWHRAEFGFVHDAPEHKQEAVGRRRFDPWSEPCELLVADVASHDEGGHRRASATCHAALEALRPSGTHGTSAHGGDDAEEGKGRDEADGGDRGVLAASKARKRRRLATPLTQRAAQAQTAVDVWRRRRRRRMRRMRGQRG
jgi:predicted N-acetyltransferase YhbS